MIEKINGCKNNPEIPSTTKLSEYIPSGFSMSTVLSFKDIENKHDVYRGKGCLKIFCEFLIEHTKKIIKFKKQKNEVINKQQESDEIQKYDIFAKKGLNLNMPEIKKHKR